MRIEEQLAESVVFLGPGDNGRVKPRGSGFFVCDDRGEVFLVTARHVLEHARYKDSLWVRLFSGGESVPLDLSDFDRWHVSATTDIAICAVSAADLGDHRALPTNAFATPDWLVENWVGPGDDVFFIGLFAGLADQARGQPIARFGNISLKPGEPVPISNADGSVSRVEAWLIEARSWGGQSGSPAFVWLQPLRYPGRFVVPSYSGGDPGSGGVLDPKDGVHLLGMVVGHFDLKQDATFASDAVGGVPPTANSGVAIVIPAHHILQEIEDASVTANGEESTDAA